MLSNNFHKQPIKIWSEFTAKGKKFWIQDVEEEHIDVVVNTMSTKFCQEEPLGYYGKLIDNQSFIHENRLSYYDTVKKGRSIICMTEDERNKPIIVGIHCQEIMSNPPAQGQFRFGYSLFLYLLEFKNILSEKNIDEFIYDRGLFVFPNYRGYGIGCELLRCWRETCINANIKLGIGLFSSIYSQNSAARAGLIELKYLSYVDIRKDLPNDIPLGIEEHTDGLKIYYVCV